MAGDTWIAPRPEPGSPSFPANPGSHSDVLKVTVLGCIHKSLLGGFLLPSDSHSTHLFRVIDPLLLLPFAPVPEVFRRKRAVEPPGNSLSLRSGMTSAPPSFSIAAASPPAPAPNTATSTVRTSASLALEPQAPALVLVVLCPSSVALLL